MARAAVFRWFLSVSACPLNIPAPAHKVTRCCDVLHSSTVYTSVVIKGLVGREHDIDE